MTWMEWQEKTNADWALYNDEAIVVFAKHADLTSRDRKELFGLSDYFVSSTNSSPSVYWLLARFRLPR